MCDWIENHKFVCNLVDWPYNRLHRYNKNTISIALHCTNIAASR